MRNPRTRKALWSLAAVLMVAGLTGASAQSTRPAGGGTPSDAIGQPKEVPLGSGGPVLPGLDLQVADNSSGGALGGISVKESEEVKITIPMGPMMGVGSNSGMTSMPPMGPMAAMSTMSGMTRSSGMAGMPGMGGMSAVADPLSQQLLSTNALLTQLLASLASQPGGISAAQLQTVNQLLANQASLLQLLLKAGGNPSTAPAAAPPGGGMPGMSGM